MGRDPAAVFGSQDYWYLEKKMCVYGKDEHNIVYIWGFPSGSAVKKCSCSAGDMGLISGLGRCPGGGHGNPL